MLKFKQTIWPLSIKWSHIKLQSKGLPYMSYIQYVKPGFEKTLLPYAINGQNCTHSLDLLFLQWKYVGKETIPAAKKAFCNSKYAY